MGLRRPGRKPPSSSCWRAVAASLLLCVGMPVVASPAVATPPPLLHALFQDHVVLQRDRAIMLHGVADPGADVRIEMAGLRGAARAAADGRWQSSLPALPAGGPHTLVVRAGAREQVVADVLVGDVWLCAGQSNMELPVWRTLDAPSEIAAATAPRIRLLTVPQAGSATAQDGFAAPVAWRPATPDSVRDFAAACWYFARELQKDVDVPMGLIAAAWGGSRIQAWSSGEALRGAGYDEELAVLGQYAADDPAGASARWGGLWQRWWRQRDGAVAGDAPWRGDAGDDGWRAAPATLGAWERWGVAELAAYDGMVWYRSTATLSAAQAAQAAVLELGAADETDVTWVNGTAVGSEYAPGSARNYALPPGLLRAGANHFVVNVLDTYRDGGLAGPADAHALRLADGTRLPLGRWQFRVDAGSQPPPAPWHTASGMTTLHNGMLAPLDGFGLRGALWYQGESNTGEPWRYAALLRGLRADWRRRFGADLPLLIVQLANYGAPPTLPGESGWAQLREAQRAVAGDDAHSGLAVTIDIGERADIHPPDKQAVGRRLARLARRIVYGEDIAGSGPVPATVRREGESIVVGFADVAGRLHAVGGAAPLGFELCGDAAGSCRWAQAQPRGPRELVLRAGSTKWTTRVRYAWADNPVVNLYDDDGLPPGPFDLPVPFERPASGDGRDARAAAAAPVPFDWFEYRGDDAVFAGPLPAGHYRNPVLAGFHSDPSVTAANGRFYLVASTFTFFPGIPVFESDDLVHWRQVGNVVERPSQLDFDGLGTSRGIFAPSIQHHDGMFYVATTAVDAGGNFIATARDPAGPWSDPHWLPGIGGIDPSLFFDDDGKVYLLNNDEPVGPPRYDGHRAIWMQQIDLASLVPFGPRRVLIDGGVDPAAKPIWIEGPNLYKVDGGYVLSAAEGGTGPQHSQVVLRSRDVWGPYVPYENNPVLTQRDLAPDRERPVTNAGHADLVQGPDGSWWAVFLASRNYDGVHYNTGREAFLLPVQWRDGWPTILAPGLAIPHSSPGPAFMQADATQAPASGNFLWRDEFDTALLRREWSFLRVPKQEWLDLRARPGSAALRPVSAGLDSLRNPAFLARRQQHTRFEASTALQPPTVPGIDAGLAAFQNEGYWYFLGARRVGAGVEVFVERCRGGEREVVAGTTLPAMASLRLKIAGDGGDYDFGFDSGDGWRWLAQDQDGHVLSTEDAGGFIGAMLGPHVRLTPEQ